MSPSTTRRPGPQRREEIALAALHILGRRGLTGLTTAALAEEVGLTSGALFRHFASLDAILEEAVRLAELRVEATQPDDSLPAQERLRRLAHARVRLLSTEPAIAWLLRFGPDGEALPPAAVERIRGLVRRSRAYIRAALEEAIEAGQVRRDVSPDVLTLIYTATVHALIRQPAVPGRRAPSTQPDLAVDGLLALLAPCEAPNPGK